MLSVAPQPGKVKGARLCDGNRARTFGVCKARMKAGLCLCVDSAADADVEHYRPWCDWRKALAELNLVRGNLGSLCPKRNCPLVQFQTVSQPLQEEKEAVWRHKQEALEKATTVSRHLMYHVIMALILDSWRHLWLARQQPP
jgi:hypothetical protein